jgi:hypothetical protein
MKYVYILPQKFLLTLLDAKSLMIVSILISSNNFFSMLIVAKLFNLSCDIVDLRWFFNTFNFEKLLSADATVIGRVNKNQ